MADEIINIRNKKLQSLGRAGIKPFGGRFEGEL